MNDVAVSISSNQPNGTQTIALAAAWLKTLLSNFRISGTYRTQSRSTAYFNAVATGSCSHTLQQLDDLFKQFELEHGRDSSARERHITPIDIDIVVWNSNIVRTWDFAQQFFQTGWQQINTAACPDRSATASHTPQD